MLPRLPFAVDTRTVTSFDGTRIAYHVTRAPYEGAKVIVLANGLGGPPASWRAQIDYLSDRYRLLTWDYRGLYGSGKPPGNHPDAYSIPNHVRDLEIIAGTEGITEAAVVGWSMGVQVSLEAASMCPERVAGLVLLNGTYGHVFSSGLQPWVRFPFAGQIMHAVVDGVALRPGLARAIEFSAPRAITPTAALFWLISRVKPATMSAVMERYMREVFDPRTFPNYLQLFQELDAHSVLHHLRDIHVPALVVSGAWDWLTPAYQSHVIAKRLPDAEAIHLRRASHFVLLERPEVVVPATERFLRQRARW
jgi:pimeloyl-ACP methyl ester carboxylesterase